MTPTKQEMFEYLDDLRGSGEINMLVAGPYLEYEFDLSKSDSVVVLSEWMRTFSERHPEVTRRTL